MAKRSNEKIAEIYEKHAQSVYKLCFMYLKRAAEAEDAAQETFMRLIKTEPDFWNDTHETAWLMRTAGNICKDMLRRHSRNDLSLEDFDGPAAEPTDNEVLAAVLALPEKYKTIVYLHYYEGLSAAEIARHSRKPAATVRGHLLEARKLLKPLLEEAV